MFYVRFIRPSGEGHEVLCTGDLEETAIPRQGEWVMLEVSKDLTIHSKVEKVTAHYHKDMYAHRTFKVDHYEIILA